MAKQQRINYYETAKSAMEIMSSMEKYFDSTNIDPVLRELMKAKASLLNGCAFCLNMHTKELRKLGVTEQRINCIGVYDDCDFYTKKEKVALELTEYVTFISYRRVPDELYDRVREHFSEKDYVDLVLIINQINNWNRLSISMGVRAK